MGWLDVFNREWHIDIEELTKNLKYCQKKEGLQIFAYVIMSSHLHMIAGRGEEDLGELLGRFKSVTAKKILKLIAEHPQESRRECLPAETQCRQGCCICSGILQRIISHTLAGTRARVEVIHLKDICIGGA